KCIENEYLHKTRLKMMKGINYLRTKLNVKRTRILVRYAYYDMKELARDFRISTPPDLLFYQNTLGWCGKAVDTLADRLQFREFRDDFFDLNGVYRQNNPDLFFKSSIKSALISACSFAYIYMGEDGFPRIQVIDGANATGVIDPVTELLTEGYAVLERDDGQNVLTEAYFTPTETVVFSQGAKPVVVSNPTNQVLLVPIIYHPDAMRPFGRSRISRACMDIMQGAMRTVKRSEIGAEFYSYPQKYISGLATDAKSIEKWSAAMSAMMVFEKDEDGDHPVLGQFQAQTMTPHLDQLKMFAALFAGETGLTMDDLGFVTENPSSAEAIKASHENLRLTARSAQKDFGTAFLNVGYVAACLRDGQSYLRRQLYNTIPTWDPVFEPDAAALSVIGDGVNKINQSVDGYIDAESLRDLTGIKPSETYYE
ncbi:MAG: phage portal protein, partial [Bacteroidales bacterium]|nr:phage portal protein [Bacteroidales bacterium]